jgi:hypothetical protein
LLLGRASKVTAKKTHWFCCAKAVFDVAVLVVDPSLVVSVSLPGAGRQRAKRPSAVYIRLLDQRSVVAERLRAVGFEPALKREILAARGTTSG